MPILGTIASSIRTSAESYESIASTLLGGQASTITFSSIPSTYKHLQIRALWRITATGGPYFPYIRFNSNAANYNNIFMQGNGSSAQTGANPATTYIPLYDLSGSGTANVYGTFVLDILDYASTNKHKSIRATSGFDNNLNGRVNITTGVWNNTAAINEITLFPETQFIDTNTRVSLYGIKAVS